MTFEAQNPVPDELGLFAVVEWLDHPEAVCWDPIGGCLYAGGEAGQIYRIDLEARSVKTSAQIDGGFILGMASDGQANVYACDSRHSCVHRIRPDGGVTRYVDGIASPQDLAFDPSGGLWVTDAGEWGTASGSLLRVGTGRRAGAAVADGLRFPTGVAVNAGHVYFVEAGAPAVTRIPLAGGAPETVVNLARCFPDGIAFDASGDMWVSCWQPNWVLRVTSSGRVDRVIDDWSGEYLMSPTSVRFGGPDLELAIFGSLGGWSVSAIKPGVRGAPLEYPILPG